MHKLRGSYGISEHLLASYRLLCFLRCRFPAHHCPVLQQPSERWSILGCGGNRTGEKPTWRYCLPLSPWWTSVFCLAPGYQREASGDDITSVALKKMQVYSHCSSFLSLLPCFSQTAASSPALFRVLSLSPPRTTRWWCNAWVKNKSFEWEACLQRQQTREAKINRNGFLVHSFINVFSFEGIWDTCEVNDLLQATQTFQVT